MAETTSTPDFVMNAITSNMSAANDAIAIAYDHLDLIAQQYGSIQNDVPVSNYVDVTISTNVTQNWPGGYVVDTTEQITLLETVDFTTVLADADSVGNEVENRLDNYRASVPNNVTEPGFDEAPEFTIEDGHAPEPSELPGESDALQDVTDIDWPGLLDTIIDSRVDLSGYQLNLDAPTQTYEPWEEGEDVRELSPLVKADLTRVLTADSDGNFTFLLPQSYWDSVWSNVSNDLAKLQAAELRNARNRGAASYWGLPTEAVLTASRAIQDEGSRKLQQTRYEQAKLQIESAQKDFWAAVEKALAYEEQWRGYHEHIQARAFANAKILVDMDIALFNARVTKYNAQLEEAKFLQIENQAIVANYLKAYATELQDLGGKLEADKQKVARYIAGWQAFQIENQIHQGASAEKIKWWATQADAHTKYLGVQGDAAKVDVAYYQALLQKLDTVSKATAALVAQQLDAHKVEIMNQAATVDEHTKRNMLSLDIEKLSAATQEANAKLQISQIEWLAGQGNALLQNMSQLANGLAQALVTVSDVNLSSGWTGNNSYNESASRNA